MESLIKLLEPFGEYLWQDSENSLDSPKIKNFLEQLLELKSDKVFSKLETSVSGISVSKQILSGTITNSVDKISIRGITEFESEQAEVVVQVLAMVSESDDEEIFEHFLCRLLNIKEVKEISVKPSTLHLPTNQNSGNVQTTIHRSLNELSRDEMWDLLSSYHFTTISANDLLGPILRNIAKEKGLSGTWGKWKRKHFRGDEYDFPRIIKEISNDSWSAREKRPNEWWISRDSHKLSKNEEQSLKVFIEKVNNKHSEIQAPRPFNISANKPKKRRIMGHIKPLRGRARSFKSLEEEE